MSGPRPIGPPYLWGFRGCENVCSSVGYFCLSRSLSLSLFLLSLWLSPRGTAPCSGAACCLMPRSLGKIAPKNWHAPLQTPRGLRAPGRFDERGPLPVLLWPQHRCCFEFLKTWTFQLNLAENTSSLLSKQLGCSILGFVAIKHVGRFSPFLAESSGCAMILYKDDDNDAHAHGGCHEAMTTTKTIMMMTRMVIDSGTRW